jgi:hypothetical protein
MQGIHAVSNHRFNPVGHRVSDHHKTTRGLAALNPNSSFAGVDKTMQFIQQEQILSAAAVQNAKSMAAKPAGVLKKMTTMRLF